MSAYDDIMTHSGTLLNSRSLPRLGTAVRTLRTRRGWTQVDLAERAGVSRQWLIKLEAGQAAGLEVGMILQVLDSLDAGLNAAPAGDSEALRAGLELTRQQLLKVAGDNGLTVVDPLGQVFDPDQQQAISQADAADAAPGTVLQVFQKGYLLNGRLLRPALVVVARHPD